LFTIEAERAILGIGGDHYPIPWPMLDYDEKLGGYCVDVTEEQLKNAPKIEQGEAGSKRTGPATKTSTIIGKSDTIGFWNRRDPSLQFGPQWRSVS
jgi:hypothetical protein